MRSALRRICTPGVAAAAGMALSLTAGAPLAPAAARASQAAIAGTSPVRTFIGQLDGAEYRVEVPDPWNGVLVLWSHGDYQGGYVPPPDQINLADQPATSQWLVGHGYAIAASNYSTPDGFAVKEALTNQIALLDWFGKTIGRPAQTISAGNSMGGLIAVLLAERYPGRFSGVLSECSGPATVAPAFATYRPGQVLRPSPYGYATAGGPQGAKSGGIG